MYREQFTCKITYSHTNVIDARPAFEDGLAHSWSRNEKKQKSLFYVTSWPFDFLQKFFVNRSRYVVVLQILSSIVVVIAACCFANAKLNKPWLMYLFSIGSPLCCAGWRAETAVGGHHVGSVEFLRLHCPGIVD